MQRIYGAFLNDMRQRLADDQNTHGKIFKGLKGGGAGGMTDRRFFFVAFTTDGTGSCGKATAAVLVLALMPSGQAWRPKWVLQLMSRDGACSFQLLGPGLSGLRQVPTARMECSPSSHFRANLDAWAPRNKKPGRPGLPEKIDQPQIPAQLTLTGLRVVQTLHSDSIPI